jgi:hypothetical protein
VKTVAYTLMVSLLALWGWSLLRGPVGLGGASGLRAVRIRPPLLAIWTRRAARRLPLHARQGPPVAVLPAAATAGTGGTLILKGSRTSSVPSPAVVRPAAPPAPPARRIPNPSPPSHAGATRAPPPCRRLVAIVHRSWAVALAHRFGVSPGTIVKRLYDVRLYRVAVVLPNAQAAVGLEQELRRRGFPQPYFRHHGGQPELSLGVFLARSAARSLLRRLDTAGFEASLEVFVRPWTTYELVVRSRHIPQAKLKRLYPGLRVVGCMP